MVNEIESLLDLLAMKINVIPEVFFGWYAENGFSRKSCLTFS